MIVSDARASQNTLKNANIFTIRRQIYGLDIYLELWRCLK